MRNMLVARRGVLWPLLPPWSRVLRLRLQLAAARSVTQQDPRRGWCSSSGARLDLCARQDLLRAAQKLRFCAACVWCTYVLWRLFFVHVRDLLAACKALGSSNLLVCISCSAQPAAWQTLISSSIICINCCDSREHCVASRNTSNPQHPALPTAAKCVQLCSSERYLSRRPSARPRGRRHGPSCKQISRPSTSRRRSATRD